MSKGPGRIERGITAAFDAEPDNAFTVEDFSDRIYGYWEVERAWRVAIIRAAKRIEARRPEIAHLTSDRRGGTLVFFNQRRVHSYAMAWMKVYHRYPDDYSEDDMRARLAPGGRYHHHILPPDGLGLGSVVPASVRCVSQRGVWWRHVQRCTARLDGDTELADRLDAELQAELDALAQAVRGGPRKTKRAAADPRPS